MSSLAGCNGSFLHFFDSLHDESGADMRSKLALAGYFCEIPGSSSGEACASVWLLDFASNNFIVLRS